MKGWKVKRLTVLRPDEEIVDTVVGVLVLFIVIGLLIAACG